MKRIPIWRTYWTSSRLNGLLCAAVVSAALSLAGCDAGPGAPPADVVERFKGTWNIVGFEDDRGDLSDDLAPNFELLRWKFRTNGKYELTVRSNDKTIDAVLTGDYASGLDPVAPVVVMESSIPCSIQGDPCEPKIDLAYAYLFSGDQAPGDESTPAGLPHLLTFTTEGETVAWLNRVLGSRMEGVVQLFLEIEKRET